jgi:hypothetical protein
MTKDKGLRNPDQILEEIFGPNSKGQEFLDGPDGQKLIEKLKEIGIEELATEYEEGMRRINETICLDEEDPRP